MDFRVELLGVSPPIWRRIQIPSDYTLWDLHVAIQDAMGWKDQHLHVFRVVGSDQTYGMPHADAFGDASTIPDHEVSAESVFRPTSAVGTYEYDFGDGWVHLLVFEGYVSAEIGSHPMCVGGERACPPEDCGGPHMYAEALRARHDPSHPNHAELKDWLDPAFDPDVFHPEKIRFSDPKARWRKAFS